MRQEWIEANQLEAENKRLEALNAELVAALKPLAELNIWERMVITPGQIKAARAALKKAESQ